MMKRFSKTLIFFLAFLLPGANMLYAWERAPLFKLPLLWSEEQISLDDFRGQIVVLDFFNANCGDCVRVSWDLETGVQEYYEDLSGNPHGIAVQVVAVNSLPYEQEDMITFLEKTELGMVLDDPEGNLLLRYGGRGLPYLAIIDATGTDPAAAAPRVVFRQAKYDGLKKIRDVIDAITGVPEPAVPAPGAKVDTTPGYELSLAPLETEQLFAHEITLDAAAMIASDVFVSDLLTEYRHKRQSAEFTLGLTYRPTRMDFKSDYLDQKRDVRLEEEFVGLQGSVSSDLNESLTLRVDGGGYDGFQTYRDLWMDEYNRLKAGDLKKGGQSEYQSAHPWGYNAGSGLRWEYLPEAGFADAGISYRYDKVSPGYEGGPPLVRLRDTYHTRSAYLSTENVLTRRLRTLVEGRIDDTTDRDARLTLQGAVNYALAENWVMKLAGGFANEEPHFTSKSVSAALERDWRGIWFVSLFGRYYEDTGEIDNGVSNDAAAPPLETYQAGLGVRRKGNRSVIKFDIGPCFSRYEADRRRNTDLDQLYKDRDWLLLQFAFQHQF